MYTSTRALLVSLYEEYLEEASFLYEQRSALLQDSERSWKDLGEFEDRFEAHIDGLVVGDTLALEICRKRAIEGDFGELHAAVRVFCRQNRKDLLLEVLDRLKSDEIEKLVAVRDALKHELPVAWESDIIAQIESMEPILVSIAAHVLGYRRIPGAKQVVSRLQGLPEPVLLQCIWALGRLGDPVARSPITALLEHSANSVRSASASALLRLGDTLPLRVCEQEIDHQEWPLIPLALAGSSRTSQLVHQLVERKPTPAGLLALGLLGDPEVIPLLLTTLTNPELAQSSALTLQFITAANLWEKVFIPDELSEDELFDEEKGDGKQTNPPLRADGKPFGVDATRLSQKQEEWNSWWAQNKSSFYAGFRYRDGQPYSPNRLVESLKSERSPLFFRQLVYEELVIRYGLTLPFETEMTVIQQVQALNQISEWAAQNSGSSRDGDWYFALRSI